MADENDGALPKFENIDELQAYVNAHPELAAEMTKILLQRPDIFVRAFKDLRALAKDQAIEPELRERAERLLKKHGFDDDSLKREDK
jgi:hypothetical protein